MKIVKQKLETETYISLETARTLIDELDNDDYHVLIDNPDGGVIAAGLEGNEGKHEGSAA